MSEPFVGMKILEASFVVFCGTGLLTLFKMEAIRTHQITKVYTELLEERMENGPS